MEGLKEYINLVYVANQFCNFGCKYCYLGKLTDNKDKYDDIVDSLKRIVGEVEKAGYGINSVSLHGSEPTAIPENILNELFVEVNKITAENQAERAVASRPFKEAASKTQSAPNPHIKTNLYNFHKLQPMLERNRVTVSGSFDLPFEMHEKFRVGKNGKSTLDRVLKNIALLKDYKYGKGLSCVVTKEAYERFDDFVRDIKYLHYEVGYDMIHNFYIMFAYDSVSSEEKFGEHEEGSTMLSQEELVDFYTRLKEAFKGTEFEQAILYTWFKEFQPGYCTYQKNCGSNQFLVQKNGDMYPCHRTQPNKEYCYGNIFTEGFKAITENAVTVIEKQEAKSKVSSDCLTCKFFKYCQQSCTIIRNETKMDRSYTCSLQKELYKDNPKRFPEMEKEEIKQMVFDFIKDNNPKILPSYDKHYKINARETSIVTQELFEEQNHLWNIVQKDKDLTTMYTKGMFKIEIDGEISDLDSGLFDWDTTHLITSESTVKLHIDKQYFTVNCDNTSLGGNNLHIQALRHTYVSYGPEGRTKMEHIFNKDVYYNTLEKKSDKVNGTFIFDISSMIHSENESYLDGITNVMYFTSKNAWSYHYDWHKKNAFYHIQAINLPFHCLNFIYI